MDGEKPAVQVKTNIFNSLDYLLAVVCFLAAIVLYYSTLLPCTGEAADVAKYHFIGKVLGLSHPPGSPFYILVNWLVAHIPVGELAWRINLLSAVSSALAGAVFFLLVRLITKQKLAALVSAGLLIIGKQFWQHAVTAELYGFFSLLILTSLLFIILWRETDSIVHYALACAFFGLSFGAHLMAVYFIPGFALFVFRDRGRILRSRQGLWATLGGAGLGMSTFLLYAIRPFFNPPFSEAHFKSPLDFFSYITGGYFKSKMFAVPLERIFEERIPQIVDSFVLNLGPLTVLLGAIGLITLLIRNPRTGITFLIPTCLSVLFALYYDVGDPEVFLLPAILGLTLGVAALACALRFQPPGSIYDRLSGIAVVLVVLWLIYPEIKLNFSINRVINDKSHDTYYDRSSKAIINAVDKNSVLVSLRQFEHLCLIYQYQGKGERLGDNIQLWLQKQEEWDNIEDVFRRFLHNRPIYFSNETGPYLVEAGISFRTIDLSETLLDYMEELPEGRLMLVAIGGDRRHKYSPEALERLKSLGIRSRPVGAYRGFLGAKFKKNGRLLGPEGMISKPRRYSLKSGEILADEVKSPLDLTLAAAGNGGASIETGRFSMKRDGPGAVVAVVDLKKSIMLDHFDISGGFESSLENVMLYEAAPVQPFFRAPLDQRIKIGQFLRDKDKRFQFDLKPASGKPMILSIIFAGQEPPELIIKESKVGANKEESARRTEIPEAFDPQRLIYTRDLTSIISTSRAYIWQCRETDARRRFSIHIKGTFQQASAYLHYTPILSEPEGEAAAGN